MKKDLNPASEPLGEHETRLRRMAYRSAHRGCKETDILFARFAERFLNQLDAQGLDAYELLLDEDDALLWEWVVSEQPPEETAPRPEYRPILAMLRACAGAGA